MTAIGWHTISISFLALAVAGQQITIFYLLRMHRLLLIALRAVSETQVAMWRFGLLWRR